PRHPRSGWSARCPRARPWSASPSRPTATFPSEPGSTGRPSRPQISRARSARRSSCPRSRAPSPSSPAPPPQPTPPPPPPPPPRPAGPRGGAACLAGGPPRHAEPVFDLRGVIRPDAEELGQAAIEGIVLARYRYRVFADRPADVPLKSVTLVVDAARADAVKTG